MACLLASKWTGATGYDEPARISCIRDDVNRSVIPHNYTEAGEYDVIITATDNDGLSSSVELTLHVLCPERSK